MSVFLEGSRDSPSVEERAGEVKRAVEVRETTAKVGGKGGGGRWLFVSHDPVPLSSSEDVEEGKGLVEKMGMVRRDGKETRENAGSEKRFIHFKFEPMVCFHFPFPTSNTETTSS